MLYKNFKLSELASPELFKTKKVGIVKTKWNTEIVESLFEDCVDQLLLQGILQSNIIVYEVPGAFELAYGAQRMIATHDCDVYICLGAIIQGATAHFDVLAHAVTQGLQTLSMQLNKPIILGVLTCTHDQAVERVQQGIAKGWADSALMMIDLAPAKVNWHVIPQQVGARQHNL